MSLDNNTVKILPKGYKGSIEPNPREIWLIQGQKEQVVMHGYWLEGNEKLVEKQQTVLDFLKNWPKKAEKIITMESDREQVKQIKLALCIYENPVEEIFNRIISHNRYEVQDRYRDDLKTIPPESRPDVKDITLLYGRHPIYHKSTDTIKPEGRGLTYNFFTKEIIKSGLTDQELTKMVRLLLKGYEQISKFNKETLEREPEEYTSHLQLQPYSTIELDRMPEFLPSLVVALFASEVSRNPVSVIPSLMLLDLIEAEEILSASCMPITWKNCLKHPDYDVGKTQKEQDSELIKLGGLHPMTHQGSYKEFKDDKYQLEESSWSHVKSAIVIIEWLTKVFCSERTMTKVEIKRLSKSEYDEKLLAEQNSVVDKKGELSFNELFDKFGNLKPDTSIEPTKELLTISLISDIMNQVKLGGEYGFSESDY